MAFIPLGKMGSAGLVLSGYGTPYLKQASYEKGFNPEHLKPYQAAFSQASKECSAATRGMTGMERAKAKSACMSSNLGGGRR
jgi:hypothetical protein